MTIRPQQMDAFRGASDQAFFAKAARRLSEVFPKHAAFMGAEAVASVVAMGVPRARTAGFKSERGLQTYLSLMVYFGSEFHRDPQYAWMQALLEENPKQDERTRIDRIIEVVGEYSAAVAGPNREYVDGALARLLERGRTIVANPPKPITLKSVQEILTEIYPEKAGRLGEDGLAGLVRSAHAGASRLELRGAGPVFLFSLVNLILGTFATEDPQFPWLRQALASQPQETEAARFARLVDRCFERLGAWTAH